MLKWRKVIKYKIVFYVLITSLIAGVFSQIVKVLLKITKKGAFTWHSLDAYGGMPSSHAAFLISLLTAVGLKEGFFSTIFAVTFIIAAIIIRDAFGLRMILEEQGKLILRLADHNIKAPGLLEERKRAVKNRLIGHRIGHTIPEIIVGSIIGFIIAFINYFIFPK